jgi:2-polyprenyl-6-hydroxyphenyl methylase/3-demethylubiquinone-9 3-methyltransferase
MTAARKKFSGTTLDEAEVRQFDALAAEWWDESGAMKPLHRLNPARMGYIRDSICAHFKRDNAGFTPLGGGLVSEPLCRMGASVTGVDAGAENIKAAKAHAAKQKLDIDYRVSTVEKMTGKFDVVTALEIIEHVADPELFVAACCKLVKKDGLIILSTLNRTVKSFLLGKVAAEYILGWVPAGTHDWKKFVKPHELAHMLAPHGFKPIDVSGLIYAGDFKISASDMDVNYFMTATRSK